jgi:hypothetical protein
MLSVIHAIIKTNYKKLYFNFMMHINYKLIMPLLYFQLVMRW